MLQSDPPHVFDDCASHLNLGKKGTEITGLIRVSPDQKKAEFEQCSADGAAGDGRPLCRVERFVGCEARSNRCSVDHFQEFVLCGVGDGVEEGLSLWGVDGASVVPPFAG